ncbi:MAG: precorrin-6y C5,15-methyltransferase (decarboxylating) subunit CbiE [Alphaproteobacteria bacterium]|jgi:precorrin-6Y C5,15-methyltransferase (decarboxylating)|nr:precorrin-6y C5,15-methyltransferase (decarboxylating) subunit CbiE [Alphaproteobacteria bacterium]
MTDPWLTVVGIGEDGLDGLGPAARKALDGAAVLVGGERHLAMVPDDGRERLAWSSPLGHRLDEIVARRGEAICVLASGDPMCFGIGTTLAARVPIAEMRIFPAPSAFSLACARLGWSLPDVECLSLHGRPFAAVNAYLYPGAKLLALSNDGATPAKLAAHLVAYGYGESKISVFERMGGADERCIEATAAKWDGDAADLNTIAVACAGTGGHARSPGLDDDAYESDGQLTKREVRAVTLSALAPLPGQLLWDVGAGAGSIAIEWLRSDPRCRAIAIEKDAQRCARITSNANALGVPGLDVVEGAAPVALAGLAQPHAIFLGGGVADEKTWQVCWQALANGGRLVANAVTVAGESRMLEWQGRTGGRLARLAVSRAEPMGGVVAWRAMRPVTQLIAEKP